VRHRSAMSMIELVVAIVVMGIAVASLPLILLQTQRSTALAMQQEVILATTTRLAFILSHEWDTFSYDTTAGVSRVLDTTSSTSADNAFDTIDANSTRRIGMYKQMAGVNLGMISMFHLLMEELIGATQY